MGKNQVHRYKELRLGQLRAFCECVRYHSFTAAARALGLSHASIWQQIRALEREFFKACRTCKKFPGASSDGTCYHCFAVGNTIDECPECVGKPWSEEFLEAKEEIEGPDKVLLPF